MTLSLAPYRRVVVLTGAGISAASGLSTYRGPNGLWNDADIAERATADALALRPHKVWELIDGFRTAAGRAEPNAAHFALAAWDAWLTERGGTFTLITQNVDGLHGRAGSDNVCEIHGNAFQTRCTNPSCDHSLAVDERVFAGEVPPCPQCGASLRPGVVLFGEMLPVDAEHRASRAFWDCDLFVAIGTSGLVYPAAGYVRSAKYSGATTMLINLDPQDRPAPFDHVLLGRAEVRLPELLREADIPHGLGID